MGNYVTELENNEEIKLEREFEYDTKEMALLPKKNEEQEFGEDIEEQIDKAEQFYLRGKHTEAIETCLEILKKNSNVSIAYEIIATSKWRQKKYNEQIEYAQKAVEIDNQNFSAYNMLGVGYSHISNAQKSIDNYFICISEEPEEYVYYRNRAISYLELENDYKIPKTLRDQFAKKANLDLNTVIELGDKFEFLENCYELYYSRGVAYLNLNKVNAAKQDLQKAIDLYEKGDKKIQDINQYKEIKQALKEIKRN